MLDMIDFQLASQNIEIQVGRDDWSHAQVRQQEKEIGSSKASDFFFTNNMMSTTTSSSQSKSQNLMPTNR